MKYAVLTWHKLYMRGQKAKQHLDFEFNILLLCIACFDGHIIDLQKICCENVVQLA